MNPYLVFWPTVGGRGILCLYNLQIVRFEPEIEHGHLILFITHRLVIEPQQSYAVNA